MGWKDMNYKIKLPIIVLSIYLLTNVDYLIHIFGVSFGGPGVNPLDIPGVIIFQSFYKAITGHYLPATETLADRFRLTMIGFTFYLLISYMIGLIIDHKRKNSQQNSTNP